MFLKTFAQFRKRPTLTTTRRANGENRASLAPGRKDLHKFLRRNCFELSVGAIAGVFVVAPAAKLRHVPETAALHVLVGDFDHQFGPKWLPGKVLTRAPAALSAGHALHFA